ncbi:hypothetical protein JAAARDRAFT_31624 [Jaapia argillacea MUCL 33604]|uniref:Nucleolar protein 16 n=1 Tax=Jaapia argillacea MUCL 33604 TaxID=933084 RepID=A0A067Q3A6_9AGAM|nr:hypothetical protein JAAARDRAFT_31624 [Jaapia argillacea MUCL 33604]
MANPRQRRKARSGSHRAVKHSQRAQKLLKKQPPIRGPKVLQDAWDSRKTVQQNYATLGLVSSLNPTQSGGIELPPHASTSHEALTSADTHPQPLPRHGIEKAINDAIPKGYGRIVRDEGGKILDVEFGQEEDEAESNSNKEEALIEDKAWNDAGQTTQGRWLAIGQGNSEPAETHVVFALEQLSSTGLSKTRHASSAEVVYLQRLVSKYGENTEVMARDRKLNVDQRTAGELARAIKKAGGTAKILAKEL